MMLGYSARGWRFETWWSHNIWCQKCQLICMPRQEAKGGMALGSLVWETERQWLNGAVGMQSKGEECSACQILRPDVRTFDLMVMTLSYGARGWRFETRWSHNICPNCVCRQYYSINNYFSNFIHFQKNK